MSPRRNSEGVEELSRETRRSLQACVIPPWPRIKTGVQLTDLRLSVCSNAQTLQSSLAALADRIDSVRVEHDKLENENKFLQDYIGGLTRTMSRNDLASGKGKK